QRDGYNQSQPLLCLLEPIKFTGELDVEASWHPNIVTHPLLHFCNSACKIAPAHTVLDGNVTLISLAKDIRSPSVKRDRTDFFQRDIRIARRRLHAHFEVPDGVDVVTVLGCQAHGDVKLPIRFKQGCSDGSAQRALN